MKNCILHIIYILFSIFLISGCQNNKKINQLSDQIEALYSKKEHREFLLDIFKSDQGIRNKEKASSEEFQQVDGRNLEKIDLYLDIHGHPKKSEVGEIAAITPWVVVHHESSPNSFEVRKKYFPVLYQAYLDGDIDDGNISFYLNRTYRIKNNSDFRMTNPYKPQDEIDSLLQVLGFDTLIQ